MVLKVLPVTIELTGTMHMDRDRQGTDDTRVFTIEQAPRRKTDILTLVDGCIRGIAPPHSVRASVRADISDPMVWIDGERIGAAIACLAANAVEAMPEGGTLTVDVTGDGQQIVITVKDTGTGITNEHMNLLFTPFFTTKAVGEHTGMGLPTAYAAVKAHGGTIAVESNADPGDGPTGSTVRITLPRGAPAEPETTRLIVHEDE